MLWQSANSRHSQLSLSNEPSQSILSPLGRPKMPIQTCVTPDMLDRGVLSSRFVTADSREETSIMRRMMKSLKQKMSITTRSLNSVMISKLTCGASVLSSRTRHALRHCWTHLLHSRVSLPNPAERSSGVKRYGGVVQSNGAELRSSFFF